jgi:hypothetical protein
LPVGGVELTAPPWEGFSVPTQRHGTLGIKGEPRYVIILIDGPSFR